MLFCKMQQILVVLLYSLRHVCLTPRAVSTGENGSPTKTRADLDEAVTALSCCLDD